MRKILASAVLALIMGIGMGQASQPANPQLQAIKNPGVEKILAAMPANLWPTKADDVSHIQGVRAWAKANEGKQITLVATATNVFISPTSHVQVFVNLQYMSADRAGVRIDITAYTAAPVTIGTIYTVTGNLSKGGFLVTRDTENKIVTVTLDGAQLVAK